MKTMICMQHQLTSAQVEELGGSITYLKDAYPELFAALAQTPRDAAAVWELADRLHGMLIAMDEDRAVLPIGSPALQMALGALLGLSLPRPSVVLGFAHSRRECIETPQPDGSIKKEYRFAHEGFEWFRY